jgi:protein-tyrosine-phosphatase/DNA-binding transcriptional ArsR family regulator
MVLTNNASAMMPKVLGLLAHELRWQLVVQLAVSDQRVQELCDRVAQPQNLVSYHLRQLREQELVGMRRSSADGRDVYYHLDLDRLSSLMHDTVTQLHPSLGCFAPAEALVAHPTGRPWRILFLCTHNSARSQLAEAVMRQQGGPAVEAFSAGSRPSRVHPLAIRVAAERHLNLNRQRSKHMDEFAGQQFDLVITVCDQVREVCPTFPGNPQVAHWSIADPAAAGPTEAAQQAAFLETADNLEKRIGHLISSLNQRARRGIAQAKE